MRLLVLVAAVPIALGCGRRVEVGSAPGPAPAPAPAPSRAAPIVSADQLVAAMRERYADRWFRTVTFVQKSSYFRTDGSLLRSETWYEAAALPGRLRIDLGDPARGNGVLYRGDSVYQLQGGRITDRRRDRNVLLILAFDAYAQPVARTLEQLRGERIDVATLRLADLDGRRVYVVGAGPDDLTSNQFWVDAERLLVVRVIQSNPERTRTQDVRFGRFVQHGGGWIAEEVRMLVGARMVFHEEYSSVRVNVPLDDALFIPERWSTAPHWYTP